MDNLTRTLIHTLSRRTQTPLSNRHWAALEFAYRHYHQHRVGPLYQTLKAATGIDRHELESLFPHGLNSLYSWVGIPVTSSDQGCRPIINLDVTESREVYLDHNATTYLRPEVQQALVAFYSDPRSYGNPSSSYRLALSAYEALEVARREIATPLGVTTDEIYFTGGGSEANNLALKGIALRHWDRKGHIISSAVEHPSVLNTLRYLEQQGFDVSYLPIDANGRVRPDDLRGALTRDTLLVSIMYANNEIGSLNPIGHLGEICQSAGVPLMVDAVQGFGKCVIRPRELGIDLLSLSGHKIYAPKGVGALYVREGLALDPLIHGGSQEGHLRAGTENVAAIQALGLASRLAYSELEREQRRLGELQTYFLKQLEETLEGYIINGGMEARLANNLNIGFAGVDSGSLLLSLNQIGIYVSAGSACSAGSREVSHVIQALGVDTRAYGVIRFSLGLQTTREDLDYLFEHLGPIVEQLRDNKNRSTPT